MVASRLEDAPVQGPAYYQNERFAVLFQGDMPGLQSIPYSEILASISKKNYDWFRGCRGTFAIAVYDSAKHRLWLISDRTSQEAFYYLVEPGGAVFSTSLATFSRLPEVPRFNVSWLYDLLFFNFPVGETTPFSGVWRMPAASVLEIDLHDWTHSIVEYARRFEVKEKLAGGLAGLERAYDVFTSRIPRYFDGRGKVACSLTGGYDSRTLLSLAPISRHDDLHVYTYGVPGCFDLREARRLAGRLGIPHMSICFEGDFARRLPGLTNETVYLSGGLQGIARATLPYIYKRLTGSGKMFCTIVSGVAGDHFFRGHGSVPPIISHAVADLFRGVKREQVIDCDIHRAVLGSGFDAFAHHVNDAVDRLEGKYGPFESSRCHLLYSIYEISPKYFGGEAAIANNFAAFRCPYWDSDVIGLACEIVYSTLAFSKFAPTRDDVREEMLQSYILKRDPRLANELIRGHLPADCLGSASSWGNVFRNVVWLLRRVKAKIENRPPVEDWPKWYADVLEQGLRKRILYGSMVGGYLSESALQGSFASRNLHLIRKLASAEILLSLLGNGWDIGRLREE
jgi:asparagine synthetase B (glutamine-hydrolysing)